MLCTWFKSLIVTLLVLIMSFVGQKTFCSALKNVRSILRQTRIEATKNWPVPPIQQMKCIKNENGKKDVIKKRICVVGGGFGGLYTALRLEQLAGPYADITIVDPKEKFVFLPLLYELTTGAALISEVAPLYRDLLSDSKVKFNRGLVTGVDTQNMTLNIKKQDDTEQKVEYDYLVLSPGSQPRTDMISGAKENAIPFYSVENAYNLKMKLEECINSGKDVIRVIVVGGGYSGVEIATNVAEYLGKKRGNVCIVDRNSKLLASSPEHNRLTAERCLDAVGVSVLSEKSVEQILPNSITLSEMKDGKKVFEFNVPADIIILTSGSEPNSLVKSLDFGKSKYGRILVNKTLQVQNTKNVYASGDCCEVDGVPLPSTAQVAMQQSQTIANNIAEEITSKSPKLQEFNYMSLGEMLTLGFKEASITGLNGLVKIDGPTAALARRIAYAVRMPTPTQTVTALLYAGVSTASKILTMLEPYDARK